MQTENLKPSHKLVLMAMNKVEESGDISDYKTICRIAGVGRTVLTEALACLKEQGLIRIIKNIGNHDSYVLFGLPLSDANKLSQHDRIAAMFELEQSFYRSAKYPEEKPEEREKKIKWLMAKEDKLKFQEKYDALYLEVYRVKSPRWGGKERGQMKSLIKVCHDDVHKAMDFIEYIFINWKELFEYWKIDSKEKLNLSIIITYGTGQFPKVAKEYGWDMVKSSTQEIYPKETTATIKMEPDD